MKSTYRKTIPRLAGALLLAAAAAGPARADDYSSAVLANNPLAYWQFKETAASPTPLRGINSGSLGGVADAYGNALVTNGVAGLVNNALTFYNPDGTSYLYSIVDIPYSRNLNSPQFSVEFWIKPTANNFDSSLNSGVAPLANIFYPNGSSGSRQGWIFYLDPDGSWNFRLGKTAGYAANLTSATGVATPDTWQQVVATYDGTNVNLYADGALISTQNAPASTTGWIPNQGGFLRLGGTTLTGYNDFGAEDQYIVPLGQTTDTVGNRGLDGLLDEVAIYTNALTAAQVAAHHAAASTPATYKSTILAANPAGYWTFDESAVTPPDPSALVVSTNSSTLGHDADGTNEWGLLTAQPGPGYAGFPADDKAVRFNGVEGTFSVNDAPGLRGLTSTVTLAAWVQPLSRDNVRYIIAHGLDYEGAETYLRITRGPGYGTGLYYEVGANSGLAASTYYNSSVRIPIPEGDQGNWVFLVGTYDGASWNLYRNGQLAGTLATNTGPVDVDGNWTIGSRGNFVADFADYFEFEGFRFAGSIAEPAIFANALTADQVSALYSAAKVPPVFTTALANPGTVFKGSTVSFSVWAEGAPTPGILWITNGVSTGVTATNFTIANIPVGTYTVAAVATNAFGTNTSSVTFSAVFAPPAIVTAPSAARRFVGFPFNFSVTATGTQPLTYFWQRNGVTVQSGSAASYSGTTSLANAGNYSVIVSNESSITVTSAPVALTAVAIGSGYVGTVVADAPVAYWRLDETSGSTAAYDVIAGNDGTYHSVTLGVAGYSVLDSDTAAEFSGANSYVGGISGTSLNFTGHTNLSVEAWVNAPSGQSDLATIIAKGIGGDTSTTRTEQFGLDVAAGVYRFFVTWNGNLYEADATDGPNGTWQHIVGVYDDANGLSIYVNGVLEGSHDALTTGLNTTTSDVSIGSKRTGNLPAYNGTFEGIVDEVAVYGTVLSADAVQAHYAAAYGTTLAPFINVQPVSITNYAGLPVTLKVSAAGSVPLTYQWKKDGVDIDGANSYTLAINPVAYSDAGQYRVAVSNSLGGLVSQPASLVVLAPPTSPPAIPGLAVHLPFTNNSLADVTLRGNDGTHIDTGVGSPTFVSDGPFGSALHYETSAAKSANGNTGNTNASYVTLGVRPDLNFGSNVSFTVAFWIRLPANYQGGDLPFFTDATNSTFNKGFLFAPTYGFYATQNPSSSTDSTTYFNGSWAFSVFDASSGNGAGGHGESGDINDGNWHHLAYVIDRQNGSTVYLDGVPSKFTKQQGTSVTAAGNIDTGAPATIGQDPSGHYGEAGSGDIADLGVWRRALTPLEATSIYIGALSNQLSYVSGPITLQILPTPTNGLAKLNWEAGTLQAAGSVQGPYTNVPGVVPPYTVVTTNPATFYRVKF